MPAKQIAALKAERKTAVVAAALDASRAAAIKSGSLNKETVNYVVKLRRVYDMLAAGFFATPNAPANSLPMVAAVPAQLALGSPPAATKSA